MVCMTSCVIAGAFLFASIFVCYHASPSWSHVSNWSSRENKQRYFLIDYNNVYGVTINYKY